MHTEIKITQKELLDNLTENNNLRDIQEYIKKVIEIRGFDNQPVQDAMLLLLEEVGELAKAIRKGYRPIDKNKKQNYDTVESEIADVLIVLTSISNLLSIDMFQALKDKETENINRCWEKNKFEADIDKKEE